MSSELFKIEEHSIPCQHIREYRRATLNAQEDVFQLHVKQYTPLSNQNPQPGDVTIIGAHANGFPKELYEPLWDEVLALSAKNEFKIRGIWIADVAWQGLSSVLNDDKMGNDPHWHDHSRDLLHMINLKRDQMPQPIVGVGHSMGGNQLTHLAFLHPRLLATMVLLDPVIEYYPLKEQLQNRKSLVTLSTFRRDLWPSREAAIASFRKSPMYRTWDPRVFDRWIQVGIRDLPTTIYPSKSSPEDKSVTLTTTKHQEVLTFLRENYDFDPRKDDPSTINRKTHPDLDPKNINIVPFYRPEMQSVAYRLPELRPSVRFILGADSDICEGPDRIKRLHSTGSGVSGSGGAAKGRVENVILDGCGHLFPMEHVKLTAEKTAEWLGRELKMWRDDEREFGEMWGKMSVREKTTVSERWIENFEQMRQRKRETPKL